MQEASDVKHEDMGITEIEVVGDEKGYLDIFSEIESGASAFTAEIDEMSEHMNIMTDNINKGTEEINRVSSNNASGIASFVRGIARKVAEHISKFDEQMVKHNLNLKVAWMNIENNCLDLIDNKHIASSDNKEVLRKLTDVLKLIKSATIQSNESVYTMIGSISAIKGVERRLNQSANSLESQMSDFLAIMENLIASVDRIVEKSKILHDSL
ncbi:MAG TPA: hypothetical protein DHV55_17160 [Clostridiaceae bacterium]|nr:hypothetical protein [Clostridiaceae bacterium]